MPTGCGEGGCPVDPVTGVVVRRIRLTGPQDVGDQVAQEYPCRIVCQDRHLTTLMCTPEHLDELALGFLFSQGLITSLIDVEDVAVEMGTGVGRVEVSLAAAARARLSGWAFPEVVFTSCGQGPGVEIEPTPEPGGPSVRDGFRIGVDTIRRLMQYVLQAPLHSLTGGTHAAVLGSGAQGTAASGDGAASRDTATPRDTAASANKGGILCLREDVGRHNALDKVIGWLLKNSPAQLEIDVCKSDAATPAGGISEVVPARGEVTAADRVLLTTGRLSSDMVLKASRLRVPVLVSRAAPTGLGVRLAHLRGITLVGFARAERLNVYTHPERVYWRDGDG